MLFSYAISNPPYQEKIKDNPGFSSQTISLFDKFHIEHMACSETTVMIYPAGRWWYDKKSPLRKALFEGKHLQYMEFWDQREALGMFPTVGIADGISVVCSTQSSNASYIMKHNGHSVVYSSWSVDNPTPITAEDVSIAERIFTGVGRLQIRTLDQGVKFMQNQAKISSGKLKELQLEKYHPGVPLSTTQVKIYANASGSIAGKSDLYVIDKNLVKNFEGKYQVCFGQSIISNPLRRWRVLWFDNETVFGNSAVRMFVSDSEQESRNFQRYASTKFFEYCMRVNIAGRKKMLGSLTPDFIDYGCNSPLDWGEPLEPQLYDMFRLSDDDIMRIEGLTYDCNM